tara:strand:- start:104 stop:688 length:585 start_codon:yes stop_codon:yes gene_type:complete
MAFNKISTGSSIPWISSKSFHNTNLNFGTLGYTTRVNGVLQGKQWLYIDCVVPQTFTGFKLHFLANNMTDRPKDYHVAGSNDNVNYTSLFHTSDERYTGNSVSHGLNAGAYRYYRLVINTIMDTSNGLNHSVHIEEFTLYKPYVRDDFAALLLMAQETKSDLNRFINLVNSWMASGKILTSSLNLVGDIVRNFW